MIKSRELFANLKISLLTLKKISIFGLVLKIACSFIIPLISVFLTYIVKCVLDGIVYGNLLGANLPGIVTQYKSQLDLNVKKTLFFRLTEKSKSC